MANLIRSVKPGSDWSEDDLPAYNITVQPQDAVGFFGRELDSIDHLDPNLLSSTDPTGDPNLSDETYRFLTYLGLAWRTNGEACTIDDFTRSVLQVTGFEERGTVIRSRYDIPLTICGGRQAARTNLCLLHLNSMVLLLVQEDKTNDSTRDPEPQVIVGAIATFHHNNRMRMDLGFPVLDEMTVPCIVMVGTRPFFYQVPVTRQLSESVITGQYPLRRTVVRRCAPRGRASEGMNVPDYRRTALQYFDAFHGLAKACWTSFLPGSG
jgi:hypothetical protein